VAGESDPSLPLASTHGLGKPEAPFLQLPLGLLRHLRTGRCDAILLTAQTKRALSARPLAPPRHDWCSGREESVWFWFSSRYDSQSVTVLSRLSLTLWTRIWKSSRTRRTNSPSLLAE